MGVATDDKETSYLWMSEDGGKEFSEDLYKVMRKGYNPIAGMLFYQCMLLIARVFRPSIRSHRT
jgi:hypothetical protein